MHTARQEHEATFMSLAFITLVTQRQPMRQRTTKATEINKQT